MPGVPYEVNTFISDFSSSLEVFKGQVKEAFESLDLTTVSVILLVVAGAVLLYDLLVYALASSASRRSLMMTPFLTKMAANAWDMRDELGLSNMIESRSLETVYPVLEAIRLAVEKYEKAQ